MANRFLELARQQRAAIQEQIDELVRAAETRVDAQRAAYRSANLGATDAQVDENVPAALTDEESARMAELLEQRSPIDGRIESLVAAERAAAADELIVGSTLVTVGNEPLTYERNGRASFFRDVARALEPSLSDGEARNRLRRHTEEMNTLAETRADMTRTDGAGGEFVPPLWLVDQYIALARAGRVTADLCRGLPLPAGTDTINLPRVATGTAVAAQADGASVQKTDMTTDSVSAGVKTYAGQQRFAMQLLDQSPINFDEVVFADLTADHAVKSDAGVINGGGGTAHSGLLGTSGIIAVTYTDASPTVPELYPKIADAIQQINTLRFLPPQAIVMHPRRWAWFLAALDSSNRPLVVPNVQGPNNAFAGMTDVRAEGSVGTLQGLPVYVDPNIPTNLGGGTNEDRIVVARFDDLYFWEGALRTRTLFETDADTLQVRLQVWNYQAFLAARYPKSIAVISGTGLATPTF